MIAQRHAFRWAIPLVFASTIAPWSLPTLGAQGNATPDAVESPLAACDEPDLVAKAVAFPNAESSTFQVQGAVLGSGPSGIIFSNESGNDPCPWLDLARELANEGFTVLLYRYSGWTAESDVAGAVGFMRERGVESVLLVGASVGANTSLIAGATIQPPVDAIAAISPGESTELEAAASQLTMPVLLVSTMDDPLGSSRATTEVLFDLLPEERHVMILPGTLHGYALLAGEDGNFFASVLTEFLARHGGLTESAVARG